MQSSITHGLGELQAADAIYIPRHKLHIAIVILISLLCGVTRDQHVQRGSASAALYLYA